MGVFRQSEIPGAESFRGAACGMRVFKQRDRFFVNERAETPLLEVCKSEPPAFYQKRVPHINKKRVPSGNDNAGMLLKRRRLFSLCKYCIWGRTKANKQSEDYLFSFTK